MCDTTAILFYSISIFYFIKLDYIISFFLLEGFLKNVGTPCVTMDFNTQLWSNFGCFWGTHMTSETSICTHSLGLSGNRVAVNPLMNQHFLCPTAMMGIWYNLFSDTPMYWLGVKLFILTTWITISPAIGNIQWEYNAYTYLRTGSVHFWDP